MLRPAQAQKLGEGALARPAMPAATG